MKSLVGIAIFFLFFHLLKYKLPLVVGDEVAGGAAAQELPERDRQPLQTVKGIQGCVKFPRGGRLSSLFGKNITLKKGKGGAISLALCY